MEHHWHGRLLLSPVLLSCRLDLCHVFFTMHPKTHKANPVLCLYTYYKWFYLVRNTFFVLILDTSCHFVLLEILRQQEYCVYDICICVVVIKGRQVTTA